MALNEDSIRRIIREELERLPPLADGKFAYTYEEAAELTGYSREVLRQAIARGTLRASYENTKPVFTPAALREWVNGMSDEPVPPLKSAW